MDHSESLTKILVHIFHSHDNGHQKRRLGAFAVMEPMLEWIPSPLTHEPYNKHWATFGIIDTNLGLQPFYLIIRMTIVGWNYLEHGPEVVIVPFPTSNAHGKSCFEPFGVIHPNICWDPSPPPIWRKWIILKHRLRNWFTSFILFIMGFRKVVWESLQLWTLSWHGYHPHLQLSKRKGTWQYLELLTCTCMVLHRW